MQNEFSHDKFYNEAFGQKYHEGKEARNVDPNLNCKQMAPGPFGEEVLFVNNDLVSFLAFWIIQQSQRFPLNLVPILTDAEEWIAKNPISEPNVSVPNFVLFKTNKKSLWEYVDKMVTEVPSIAVLNERSERNNNDFIDLVALSRNIANSVSKENK